jgi:hypothetical protein
MELPEFIVKAKKNTYAKGIRPKVWEGGFKELTFAKGNLSYQDRWAQGQKSFGGEEVVFRNNEPIWIMNYYGIVISDVLDIGAIYNFLKKAMSLVGEQKPFRGPSEFREGDFEYKDRNEGDISRFKGTEEILFKGKKVYVLEYHGGYLS